MADYKIKKAELKDVLFIINAIVEAEKSNLGEAITSKLFNISESDYKLFLDKILCEDIPNYDLSLSSFIIAFEDEKPVATICYWCEQLNGLSSDFLRMNAYKFFMKPHSFDFFIKETYMIAKEFSLSREPLTLQFDSLFVEDSYRGKGLTKMLMNWAIEDTLKNNSLIYKAQHQFIKQNIFSLNGQIKLGFEIIDEIQSTHPNTLKYYPGNIKVKMEKKL